MISDNKSRGIIFSRINELETQIDLLAIKMSETGNSRTYRRMQSKLEELLILKKLNEALLYKETGFFENTTLQ